MIEEKLITLEDPQSYISEIYRRVRTNIEYASLDKKIKTVNITSTIASETKTTTACNLAVMYANKFEKVLLVDTDLRKPTVHRFLRIKNQLGLTDFVLDFSNHENQLNQVDISKYIQTVKHTEMINQLDVITAGTKVSNPAEFLGSNAFREFLNRLKNQYDIVIVDSAPSGIIIDGLVVSSACDATVYVTEYNKLKVDIVKHSIDSLKHADANVIGCLVTKTPLSKRLYNRYYYNHYNYKRGKDEEINAGRTN